MVWYCWHWCGWGRLLFVTGPSGNSGVAGFRSILSGTGGISRILGGGNSTCLRLSEGHVRCVSTGSGLTGTCRGFNGLRCSTCVNRRMGRSRCTTTITSVTTCQRHLSTLTSRLSSTGVPGSTSSLGGGTRRLGGRVGSTSARTISSFIHRTESFLGTIRLSIGSIAPSGIANRIRIRCGRTSRAGRSGNRWFWDLQGSGSQLFDLLETGGTTRQVYQHEGYVYFSLAFLVGVERYGFFLRYFFCNSFLNSLGGGCVGSTTLLLATSILIGTVDTICGVPLATCVNTAKQNCFGVTCGLCVPIRTVVVKTFPITLARLVDGCHRYNSGVRITQLGGTSNVVFFTINLFNATFVVTTTIPCTGCVTSPGYAITIFTLTPAIFFSSLTSTGETFTRKRVGVIPASIDRVLRTIFGLIFNLLFTGLSVDFLCSRCLGANTIFNTGYTSRARTLSTVCPFASTTTVTNMAMNSIVD